VVLAGLISPTVLFGLKGLASPSWKIWLFIEDPHWVGVGVMGPYW
jgi:hypothetical protein